jgi:serine/threonine protein kinase/WD40 repeat protein
MASSIDQGGNLLDRLAEEFVERLRRGERPIIDEYAEHYPELGDRIRGLFPTLILMEQLKPTPEETLDGLPFAAGDIAHPLVKQLGDYRIIREVGRGGMGVVYEAEQVSLGRRVALKVLPKRLIGDELQKKRFLREARAAARLCHTSIVPVFGVGDQDGLLYYVMQFIHGQGLDLVLVELRRLRQAGAWKLLADAINAPSTLSGDQARACTEGPFPGALQGKEVRDAQADSVAITRALTPSDGNGLAESPMPAVDRDRSGKKTPTPSGRPGTQESGSGERSARGAYCHSVARIGQQVAEALAYAHGQGIVHRDIKPANLLLDMQGTIWITDFGLAKADDQQALTQSGDVLGTLRYMAPERFQGNGDSRSDIYALGMTLYEMLVLRPAYDGVDRARLIQQVLHASPPRLRLLDPAIPRDLETIVHKAIEREPAHRYPTAAALASDLQRYLRDEPIHARRASPLAQLARWCRKNRMVAALAAVATSLLLLVIAVLAISQVQLTQQRNRFRDAIVQSLVAESRFRRTSGEAGQREESLRRLTEAARFHPEADLRNEVIRCLALHDLDPTATWPSNFANHSPDSVAFDPSLRHYVSYTDESAEVRTAPKAGEVEATLVQRLALGESIPRVARISRDGRFLALRANDNERSELTVWQWRAARQVLHVPGVAERAFDFDRHGTRLVCGLRDGTMKTFDLASGKELAMWTLPGPPFDVHLAPGRSLVACTIPDAGRVQVFDCESGMLVYDLDFGEDIYAVAWHPAGDRLAVGDGFDVAIVRLDRPETPRAILTGHRWMIHALEYHPSGEFLVSHSLREGLTRLWDVRTRRELVNVPGHFVRFNETGDQLAIVHNTTLEVRRFCGENEYQTLADPEAESVDSWRAIPHPTLPILFDCGRHGIRCWNVGGRRLLATSSQETIYTVRVDPATGDLLSAGERGLQRWPLRVEEGGQRVVLGAPEPLAMADGPIAAPTTNAFGLDCTADGSLRVASFRGEPHLYVQHVPSGRVRRLPCDPLTAFIAVSPHGRWIAGGNYQFPGFSVWDLDRDGAVQPLHVQGSAAQVMFSPDGEHLVACANDRYALFQVGAWAMKHEIVRPMLIEGGAAFSPDSRILALAMGPREVQLREVATGRILATLDSGRDPVNILNVNFHPQHGETLFLACGPYGIRCWDLAVVRKSLREMGLDW